MLVCNSQVVFVRSFLCFACTMPGFSAYCLLLLLTVSLRLVTDMLVINTGNGSGQKNYLYFTPICIREHLPAAVVALGG